MIIPAIAAWYVASLVWSELKSIDESIAVASVAGFATIVSATATVMLGRYLENKREIATQIRKEKIKIYTEFLSDLFRHIARTDEVKKALGDEPSDKDLLKTLAKWQETIIIWGGQNVIKAYFEWINMIKRGKIDAEMVFAMDRFIRCVRSEVGNKSYILPQGYFAHSFLREADLFLKLAKKNPKMTLAEMAEYEVILDTDRSNNEP